MLRYFCFVIVLSLGFTILLWLVTPRQEKTISYTSPIPKFLSIKENDQVKLLDVWLPHLEQILADGSDTPIISAKSVLLFDLETEKVLYEKAPKKRVPMASLTKVMTAIIALENKKSDDQYRVTPEDLVGENAMGVEPGEVLSLKELLYGLILHSGNDAAEVLAHNYPGGRMAFLQAMNDKAVAMGLSDTHFSNPTGLEGDGVQYTTAYDLLVITRYALDHFPEFREVGATYQYDIPSTSAHKRFFLTNETNLITSYPGVKGLKIGYTPEAGMCLITYLEYKDHKIVGIILNSENRRQEMKDLLDYSLRSLGVEPPAHQ